MIPQNLTFAMSHRIAPSFHIGPRAYGAGNIIVNPLAGAPMNAAPQAGLNTPAGAHLQNTQAGLLLQGGWPHPFTINGRAPG